jgi:hypothetical protein
LAGQAFKEAQGDVNSLEVFTVGAGRLVEVHLMCFCGVCVWGGGGGGPGGTGVQRGAR